MDWASEDHPAELAADAAAAAAFAAAVAFAAWSLATHAGSLAMLAAAPSFLLAYSILRQVRVEQPDFALPAFDLAPIEPERATDPETDGELVLTLEQMAVPPLQASNELLLEDRLALDPDARVIRLFDPRRTHGPGAFQSRAAPVVGWSESATTDASQALSKALAQLRRSLR